MSSTDVLLPCEGIGSLPRPASLQASLAAGDSAQISLEQSKAVSETIATLLDITGGTLPISDGEQSKHSFVTYSIAGLTTLRGDGIVINFEDGHTRQLPVITEGPFEYCAYAVSFLTAAQAAAPAGTKFKQAVIAPSAMSLLYPSTPIEGYAREAFIEDVVRCATKDIRQCLEAGADSVQMDFTEGRLALKLDPSGGLLDQLIALNERVIRSFSEEDRKKIGVHVCPGADHDSTHSADVEYSALLTRLLDNLSCGRFYLQMKSERDPNAALSAVRDHLRAGQLIFVGVTDVNTTVVESAEEVCAFIENAATYIPTGCLGVCDDCGFSPFCDDVSTSRAVAFDKIRARVAGTRLASKKLLQPQ